MKRLLVVMLTLACAGGIFGGVNPSFAQGQTPERRMVFPDQGWSSEDRLRYYFTSQGSAALSYDVFLNLEAPGSQQLFRSDDNSRRFGLFPFPADPRFNPDGLPIGLAKTVVTDGQFKGEWVGVTCAACHDNEIKYRGTSIKVSGGNNNRIDFMGYISALSDALDETVNDPARFDRMAQRAGADASASRAALRKRLEADALAVKGYDEILALTPSPAGPGRMDALRLIHNQVVSRWLGIPQNWSAPLAPAKPSLAWNMAQSNWTQWSGVLNDPLLRNLGESLGVFVRMDLTSKTRAEGLFESTADIRGQIAIENLLRRLAPPQWPEDVLGKIDRDKAAQGKALFAENCSSCHSRYPHRWSEPQLQGKRFIENAIIAAGTIGTDPGQFSSPQFDARPSMMTGSMSGMLEAPATGALLAPAPAIFLALSRGVYDTAMAKLGLSNQEVIEAHGFQPTFPAALPPIPALGYKAAPIEGMWTSPPYLHNGSVPNLYELLSPAAERSKTFLIGDEFDPVNVGIDTSGKSGSFRLDTALIGNSNSGHSFESGPLGNGVIGRALSVAERWALVEYVKSLPDAPAQIAPFGGPKNPVEAWQDPDFFHVRNPGTFNGAPAGAAVPAQAPAASPKAAAPVSALEQEQVEPDEAKNTQLILDASIARLRSQFPDGQTPVMRDAHPKAHGLVSAQFIVLDGLPAELRHGIFSAPRTFDALIRFSAGNVEVQPDTVPQAAGMAIKLLGVEGEKLLPSEKQAQTQDFIMINSPNFFVKNLADYVELHEALGRGRLEEFFKTRPEETAAIVEIRSQKLNNPVQARYWSMTPYLLGGRAIKFSALPISLTANLPPAKPGPDFMREAMKSQVSSGDVYYEFAVQLQTDPATMPLENPVKNWDEAAAPFQRVAIIRIPRQDIDAPGRVELAENLAFTPWHSLPEHRPLGSMNRSRLRIYEGIAEFRRNSNGVSQVEPTQMPF